MSRLRFSPNLPLHRVAGELHRRSRFGKTEAGAFLLGRVLECGSRVVEDAIYFDDVDPEALRFGSIRFDTTKMGLVEDACERLALRIVADVHTHPGEAFQSPTDQAHPVISVAGHIALVLPYDGRYRTPNQIGMFVLKPDGGWAEIEDAIGRGVLTTGEALSTSTLSRAELLLLDEGMAGERRRELLRSIVVGVRASAAACQGASGQAAVLSAITLLTRFAEGGVRFEGDWQAPLAIEPGRCLGAAARRCGARPETPEPNAWITIGDVTAGETFSVGLIADDGLYGCGSAGDTSRFRDSYVPGVVAAAALAVGEIFRLLVVRKVEIVPRARLVRLFEPGLSTATFQDATRVNAPIWLAGFGHLGNAVAWVMAMCPGFRPPLLVQDTQSVEFANASTQVFFTASDDGRAKTDVAAAELARLGFKVRTETRPLNHDFVPVPFAPHEVLSGFDNAPARRALEATNASTIVDAGLGGGPTDYTTFSVRCFTDPSMALDLFPDPALPLARRIGTANESAYREVNACGLAVIEQTAIAVPFVGFVVAAISVTRLLRERVGLGGFALASGDVLGREPLDFSESARSSVP